MKRILKILACLSMCLSLTGCFSNIYTRNAKNNLSIICSNCKAVNNINDLVDNMEIAYDSINAMSGEYVLVNTKTTFVIDFDAIISDEKINWDIYAKANYNDKDVNFYLKNGKLYVIYPRNSANVIIKDKLENFVAEADETLEKLNAVYDKENLENIITGDKAEGLNFELIRENGTYTKNSDGTYTVRFMEKELSREYDVDANFLIKESRCTANNFYSILKFSYPNEVTITYPMGLDFLTANIKEVKKVLDVDSFAELIDESLKEEKSN